MSTLLILRGVPASGKTTYARTLTNYTVVSRDDIRFTLFGKYLGVDEQVVTEVEDAAITAALRAGQNVVLDATNLRNKFVTNKLSLASEFGATVKYVDFPINYEEAVTRDLVRRQNGARGVGPKVIRDFFNRYKIDQQTGILKPPPEPFPLFEPYVRPEPERLVDGRMGYAPDAIVVDIDGTLANHEPHRSPYDTSKYAEDTVFEHVRRVVNAYGDWNDVILLSGRDSEFRDVTEAWLNDNVITWSELFMREQGDKRNDAVVKYELFKKHVEPNYNVIGVFDDRPRVIRMWRAIGLPVFNVGNGVEF